MFKQHQDGSHLSNTQLCPCWYLWHCAMHDNQTQVLHCSVNFLRIKGYSIRIILTVLQKGVIYDIAEEKKLFSSNPLE